MVVDTYLVTMLPQSRPMPAAVKRSDLVGRTELVYQGKTAGEWYSQYCTLLLRTVAAKALRENAVQWLRENVRITCEPCEATEAEANCHRACDLRMYDDKRTCECCYNSIAWAADDPEPPKWAELPVFDPFKDLV